MPGLQTAGQGSQYYNTYYGATTKPPKPDDWYSYQARSDYLQTTEFANVSFDITPRVHVEAGTVHFGTARSLRASMGDHPPSGTARPA
jgi:hypothetical protein